MEGGGVRNSAMWTKFYFWKKNLNLKFVSIFGEFSSKMVGDKSIILKWTEQWKVFEAFRISWKELSFCHTINHYIFATWWSKPLIFQAQIFDLTEFIVWNIKWLGQWGIRISEFVAKTQFLSTLKVIRMQYAAR